MNNKKHGFTLAEALIALLIASLIIAAIIPVITKKHRKIEVHGKWECTVSGGSLKSRTYTNGIPDEWKDSNCMFSPPAGAENFRVTVVGGGGGGAGGTGGRFRSVFSSESPGGYYLTAPRDGSYYISLLGGGGAGGGMGCGSPEGIDNKQIMDNFFPRRYESDRGFENPGNTDYPDPTFDYSVLYSNATDANDVQLVRKYLDESNPNKFCFAEPGWKEWDFENPDNCWNWPGQGAYGAGTSSRTVKLFKGQSVYIYIGNGGSRGSTYLKGKVVGAPGGSGEDSFSSLGDSASGSSNGASRVYRYSVSYKDIPARNCKRKVYDRVRYEYEYVDHSCSGFSDAASCSAQSGCTASGEGDTFSCSGTYTEEIKKEIPYKEIDEDTTNCTNVIRRYTISFPACVTSTDGAGPNSGYTADKPDLTHYIVDTDPDSGETTYEPTTGAGGFGAGKTMHLLEDGTKSYLAASGVGGSAEFNYADFFGGGGGEAGQIATSVFKKLTRTAAVPGAGGSGSAADSELDGANGGDSSFGSLLFAGGGKGGKANSVQTGMVTSGLIGYFPGGNGGYAPLYANLGGHGDRALGGRNSGRTSNNGMSAFTPLSSLEGLGKVLLQFYLQSIQSGLIQPMALDFFGGFEGDFTYGAGGGGGAGGGREPSHSSLGFRPEGAFAGSGGNGAAGIVIVEW